MITFPADHPYTKDPWFPEHHQADSDGLLMLGGKLTPDWLLYAYNKGIFPWYNNDQPILWWSPDPRMVVKPEDVKVSKSMRKVLRDNDFKVTYNQNFIDVILACKRIKREGQNDTWITNDIVTSYLTLHQLGQAISVEVWYENNLVGGLYGVDLKDKGIFCGESMFAKMSNASKVGFITLSQKLKKQNYHLIDCQMYTDHLASLGAEEIPRDHFLEYLK